MNHLNALYSLLTDAGSFSAGVIAGILVPLLTAAAMRRWWDRTRPLTRAATIVASIPTLVFAVLLVVAPPAASGWSFVIGFVLFAMFSLPTWLALLGVVWLVLVIKRRFSVPTVDALPAEVHASTVHAVGGVS